MNRRLIVQTALIMGLFLTVGCGADNGNNFPQVDREAPSSPLPPQAGDAFFDAELITPADTALGVRTDTAITVQFSLPPASGDAVTLTDRLGIVPATLICNDLARCELTPDTVLDGNTDYRIVVAAGTLAVDGSVLQHSRVWDFRTGNANHSMAEVVPLVPVKRDGGWSPGVRVAPNNGPVQVTLSSWSDSDGPWHILRATSLFKTAAPLPAHRTHTVFADVATGNGGPVAGFTLPVSIGWTDVTPSALGAGLNDVTMLSHKLGWAVGDAGTILTTDDGGHNWAAIHAPVNPANGDLLSVAFVAPDNGFITGTNGTLLHTDNGASWSSVATATTAALRDVAFAGPRTGFVVGDRGTVLKTVDGGHNWAAIAVPTVANLSAIACLDDHRCVTVGGGGTILATRDGGATWKSFHGGTMGDLSHVTLHGDGSGWITGEGGLLLVGGVIEGWWVRGATGQNSLAGITFADSAHGWAAGTGNAVIVTRNGGVSWSAQPLAAPTAIAAIAAQGNGQLVAVGRDGSGAPVILRTDTGGEI